MPDFELLQDWLEWQETLHPDEIELGLERTAEVFQRLHPAGFSCPVITVAGTNGKGSSIRMLESIYRTAGYKTACYTSPHLLHYNERININGRSVDDQQIVHAFRRIEQLRDGISLTYFEFGTLAALDIFIQQQPDIVLLEVGLGGRLDAVNIIDADVALITSISIDHTQWLGDERESIGREKAGIMRNGKPAVCSDPGIPQSVVDYANELNVPLYRLSRDFEYVINNDSWTWNMNGLVKAQLPAPGLSGRHQYQNAAGVLMAVQLLQEQLPVADEVICRGLSNVHLAGRFQQVSGQRNWFYDVAHNPESVGQLAELLSAHPVTGSTHALLGMLADKDITQSLELVGTEIDNWYLSALPTSRSAATKELKKILVQLGMNEHHIASYPDVKAAWQAIARHVKEDDRVIIFGSFYTVAEAMKLAEQGLQ